MALYKSVYYYYNYFLNKCLALGAGYYDHAHRGRVIKRCCDASVCTSVCLPSPELKTVHLGHGYNRTLIVLEVEPSDHRK